MSRLRKLVASEVLAICSEYADGASMKTLARKHRLHYENVRNVIHCRTYKEVRRPILAVRPPGARRKVA